MKTYPGTSYWDAYAMPVPVRKWLIKEHIKQINEEEQQNRQQNHRSPIPKQANTPLSAGEKQIISNQIQPFQSVKK